MSILPKETYQPNKPNLKHDDVTLDVLNSFTAILRESSDSNNLDNAPVLSLHYIMR